MSIETTETTDTTGLTEVTTQTTVIDMPTGDPLVIENTTITTPPTEEWLRDKARIAAFFDDPIGYSSTVLKPYLPTLKAIGWALLAIVAFNLLLTLLGAILKVATSIPVFSPLFELIGIVYTGWFVYRYLLTASQRQEFSQKVSKFKSEVVGDINDVLGTDKNNS
ncbi:CAAD domain-containing protein [Phormidesmis priestleyi]